MDAPTIVLMLFASAAAPAVFDPAARTEPVACDRLTSGRYDRERLAPPVARADIDVPAAIEQCLQDLKTHPGDARIHFQLGRLYGYLDDQPKAREHREAAAAAGYPSAIFLLGYLDMLAADDEQARCAAGERMRLAADRGGYAGQVAYTAYVLEGRFDGCPDVAAAAQLRAYLAAAKPAADGFFEQLLIGHLVTGIDARR